MPFKPFSLANAIKETQEIKLNRMKLGMLQADVERKRDLKQMASESTRPTYEEQPVYGETEGPPTAEGDIPEIQTGTEQVQTGEEYDPEMHQQKLAEAGEVEEMQKIQTHLGKMDKQEREESIWKLEGVSRLMADVRDEETFNQREQEAVNQGFMTQEQADAQSYNPENVVMLQNMGRKIKDLYADEEGIGSGTSEFERHAYGMYKRGEIDEQGYKDLISKRAATMAGTEQSTHQKIKSKEKRIALTEKKTKEMRDDAGKGVEHFQKQRTAVNDAIAALESGNNALADTMVNQIMSQVVDSKVRAFQMYSVFDRTYGNIANRVFKAASQFVTGAKTEEDRKIIKDTLLQFKKYSDPAANTVRNRYRSMANDSGLDPFKVVPPDSMEDVRDSHATREQKLRALKVYFPDEFK